MTLFLHPLQSKDSKEINFKVFDQTMSDLTKIKTQTLLNTIKRCSKLALTCVVTDSVCMVLYILLMNYTPINLVNLLYLIDSNINLLRYVNFLGRELQTIISPLTTKKSNYDSKIVAKCTHALAREKSSEFVCA